MELSELRKKFDKLPEEQVDAILDIIEHKTNEDMKEVISEIKSVRNEIKILYWVIGLAFTIIAVLIAVLALRK